MKRKVLGKSLERLIKENYREKIKGFILFPLLPVKPLLKKEQPKLPN